MPSPPGVPRNKRHLLWRAGGLSSLTGRPSTVFLERDMYVRFVFAKPERGTNRYVGILHDRRYGGWGTDRIGEIYVWFRKNLKRPPLEAFSQARALCWFKPEAVECIDRMVDLIRILERRGERVW